MLAFCLYLRDSFPNRNPVSSSSLSVLIVLQGLSEYHFGYELLPFLLFLEAEGIVLNGRADPNSHARASILLLSHEGFSSYTS